MSYLAPRRCSVIYGWCRPSTDPSTRVFIHSQSIAPKGIERLPCAGLVPARGIGSLSSWSPRTARARGRCCQNGHSRPRDSCLQVAATGEANTFLSANSPQQQQRVSVWRRGSVLSAGLLLLSPLRWATPPHSACSRLYH